MGALIDRSWRDHPVIIHMDYAGSDNAIGDYSAAPVEFDWHAPSNFIVTHFVVVVEDAGDMDAGFYGNGIILTNGIRLVMRDAADNEVFDLLNGETILVNADWSHFAEDLKLINWKLGNTQYAAHFEFFSQWGVPFFVPKGYGLHAVLNDDFTGLVRHHFLVTGKFVGPGGGRP